MLQEQIKIIGDLAYTISDLKSHKKLAIEIMIANGLVTQLEPKGGIDFYKLSEAGLKVYNLFKSTIELF